MATTFELDLVTPERTFFSGPVQEFVAPGVVGEFGVLPGHANLLAALKAGGLVYKDESGEHEVVVAGGFADVTGEKVTVLLDNASTRDELDAQVLQKEIEELEAQEPEADSEDSPERVRQLAWKNACLEWVKGK